MQIQFFVQLDNLISPPFQNSTKHRFTGSSTAVGRSRVQKGKSTTDLITVFSKEEEDVWFVPSGVVGNGGSATTERRRNPHPSAPPPVKAVNLRDSSSKKPLKATLDALTTNDNHNNDNQVVEDGASAEGRSRNCSVQMLSRVAKIAAHECALFPN